MFTAAELAEFRSDAEELMTATFSVQAPGSATTVVDGFKRSGLINKTPTVGKIQGGAAAARDTVSRYVSVGGVKRPVLEGGLHIPIDAEVPCAGDEGIGWIYTCTAVCVGEDPALVGRSFLVVSAPAKSFASARRLDVVEVPR
jgi:Family of unknown function (DUF6093)